MRESEVSQGTLYLHFAKKDDIVITLAGDRQQAEAFLNALTQHEQDATSGLMLLIELHGKGLIKPGRPDGRRISVQGWGEALRNSRILAKLVEGQVMVSEAIARLIERGQRTGQIRPSVDPAAVARTLSAICHGFVLQVA